MSQKTYMYDTQWQALINAISGGDTSAIATALGQIKTSIDSIETALGNLSTDVTQNSTQWNNLVNAITNQSLTVDLSNLTSSAVSNLSNVTGATVTDAINLLISTLTNESKTFDSGHLRFDIFDKFVIVSGYYVNVPTGITDLSSYFNSDQMAKVYTTIYSNPTPGGIIINAYFEITPDSVRIINNTGGILTIYFDGIYFRNK